MLFEDYKTEGFFDEIFLSPGQPHPHAVPLVESLNHLSYSEVSMRQSTAEAILKDLGITFRLSADEERIFPFDIIPRLIDAKTWSIMETGLKQRVQAINLFLADLYGPQDFLKNPAFDAELIFSSPGYLPVCRGLRPHQGIFCHISGIDLIRHSDGEFYVLEDNLRCPSGVSYVVENRQVLKRTFPRMFSHLKIRPVDDYPEQLLKALSHVSRVDPDETLIVLLTPGVHNSAYYEHSYLAKSMGVPLVEGPDLCVEDDAVWLKTTAGKRRVHVIYRRIDDDFLDPRVFRSDSLLGVPGLFQAYAKGQVSLVNAPGNGIADDKAVYALMPDIIRHYLAEEPILKNVPTFLCSRPGDRAFVLEHLPELVVKCVSQSGGYGMLIGPMASRRELENFRHLILESPRNYIAQPTLSLSRMPTMSQDHFEGRHVDLRPFVLARGDIYVQPGGLTRVALQKGSLIVNSSQGGGSKDTWVLRH